jgi:hypothetical protein
MLAAFTALEARVRSLIHELDTEGRAECERLVAEVKTEAAADLAKIRVLATDLEAGLGKAAEAAGPAVAAAVKAETAKFLAGLAPLLAEAATEI